MKIIHIFDTPQSTKITREYTVFHCLLNIKVEYTVSVCLHNINTNRHTQQKGAPNANPTASPT